MQGDLVQRLRDRAYSGLPDPLSEQAADEIERLRGYRDVAEADRDVAMLVAERLRLTDAEREAIEIAIPFLPDGPYTEYDGTPRPDRRATLRALLDRTK